jgi:hypothetical protein
METGTIIILSIVGGLILIGALIWCIVSCLYNLVCCTCNCLTCGACGED